MKKRSKPTLPDRHQRLMDPETHMPRDGKIKKVLINDLKVPEKVKVPTWFIDNVKRIGIFTSIIVEKDGFIVDGVYRYWTCKALKIKSISALVLNKHARKRIDYEKIEQAEQLTAKEARLKELEDRMSSMNKELQQKRDEEYCREHGHDYFRHPYCGIGDTNYLTCTRCGHETTD
jgi:hypothetical protein